MKITATLLAIAALMLLSGCDGSSTETLEVDPGGPTPTPIVVPTPTPEPDPVPVPTPEPDPVPVPTPTPEPEPEPIVETPDIADAGDWLAALNEFRTQPQMCGEVEFDAAPELPWDARLAAAATLHASDMATNNFYSHIGSDGMLYRDRWDLVGFPDVIGNELLFADSGSFEDALAAWTSDPETCAQIMLGTGLGLNVSHNLLPELGATYEEFLANHALWLDSLTSTDWIRFGLAGFLVPYSEAAWNHWRLIQDNPQWWMNPGDPLPSWYPGFGVTASIGIGFACNSGSDLGCYWVLNVAGNPDW